MDRQPRKAKTHKGRKILEAKLPKVDEPIRKTLFIRGNKTSEPVSYLM